MSLKIKLIAILSLYSPLAIPSSSELKNFADSQNKTIRVTYPHNLDAKDLQERISLLSDYNLSRYSNSIKNKEITWNKDNTRVEFIIDTWAGDIRGYLENTGNNLEGEAKLPFILNTLAPAGKIENEINRQLKMYIPN